MKKTLFAVCLVAVLAPAMSFAAMSNTSTGPNKMELGVDVEMPYVISVDGSSVNDRGDTSIGVHGNYFLQPDWSVGLQLDFGIETQAAGADNAILLTPGTAWYFMPDNTWDPYVRFDVPMFLTGGGSTGDGFDAGVSGGVGLQWNLNEMTGVNGLALKYDTALNYFFDAKALSWNIFRFAFAYCW